MSKKLLLTLLPLTFLVAACSGANRPAQSSSHATGLSTSSVPASTSEPEPDPESSSLEPDPSQGGSTDPVGVGFEVKVGQYYYELVENSLPDEGRSASYTAADVSFETGDKVSVYLNGEAVEVWAEADSTNGVYPNYDERPQDSKYSEFTITEGAIGNIYFHVNVNSDDSYSIWITPNQESGQGGGGGGEVIENKYCIYSVTNGAAIVDLVLNGKDPTGRDQAQALGVSLTQGDVIQLYDNENAAGWITTVEGYSFGGDSESSTAWEAYLEAGTDSWTILQDVTVDIYAKFAFGNDSIYFGISSAA